MTPVTPESHTIFTFLTHPNSDTTVFICLLPTYDVSKIISNILAYPFFMRRCSPVECVRVHKVKPTEQ